MLELVNVDKSFGPKKVVRNFSAKFETAKTHVLIGPSGCGKSTILKMLIGLVSPDSGKVLLDDQPLQEQSVSKTRKRFGYVIQSGGLFPHLTAAENIALPARWHRWSAEDTQSRIQTLADLTQFPEDGLNRYPIQLSGGQQQRVGLMRALILEPDVLLLDEPLGALDPMIRNQLQIELRSIIRKLKKTVVMVTHDLSEAAWFADQVLLLRQGELCQRGSIEQLLDRPVNKFAAEFVQAQRSHLPDTQSPEQLSEADPA